MERLTERTADGIMVKENYSENALRTFYQCFGGKPNANYSNCEEGYCAMEKLAAYEDAEEQGLLLRLPCKVGTIIYKIENNTDACCKCNDFKISHCDDDLCGNKNGHDEGGVFYVLNPQYADKPLCKKQFYEIKEYKMKTIDEIFWLRNDFCKTVFLTGEEAEAKLKEMEGAE